MKIPAKHEIVMTTATITGKKGYQKKKSSNSHHHYSQY